MSFQCSNPECANANAQLPRQAAEKFDYICFLCGTGELVEPAVTLEDLLVKVDILPVSLQILPRLQALLNDDNSSLDDIASTTRTDASLVSRLIHVSNSAYYSLAHGGVCISVEQALTRIGLNKAYSVVGYVAAKQVYCKYLTLYGLSGQQMWEDSVRTAFCMEQLAPEIFVSSDSYEYPDPSIAYTAGLLWPVGKMVISQFHQNGGCSQLDNVTPPLDSETEKEILGFTHLDVTLGLMEKWSFPAQMTEPIQYKDNPLRCPKDRPFACLLSLVIASAEAFPVGSGEADIDEMAAGFSPDSETLAITGIPKMEFLEVLWQSIQFVKTGNIVSRLK